MKKEDVIKFLEGKENEEFVINTQTGHDELITNTKKAYDEEVVPNRITEIYTGIEADVKAITGEEKLFANGQNEKAYDYVKRQLSTYFEKAKGIEGIRSERDALQKAIDEGNTDEQLAKDLKQVRADYVQLQKESAEQVSEVKGKFDIYKIQADVRSPLSGITFNKKYPESVIQQMSDAAVDKLTRKAKMVEGKMVFLGEDGETLRNKNNMLNPYTADELLKEELKDIIETDGHSGPAISEEIHKEFNDKGELKKVLITIPNSVNTKIKLGKHLVEKGLLRGTPEYNLAYAEYGKDLPLQ